MDGAKPIRDDVAAAELSAAARRCADAKQRGVILALASLHEGVEFRRAARIWGVDPAALRHALQHFEEKGLDGLSDKRVSGASRNAAGR